MNLKIYTPYAIIAAVICLFTFAGAYFSDDLETTKSTVAGGLIGVVIVLAMPIYEIDRWSLFRRSLLHFLIMALTVLPLVMFGGWFDWSSTSGFLTMIGVFLLSGVAAWSIGYTANLLNERRKK